MSRGMALAVSAMTGMWVVAAGGWLRSVKGTAQGRPQRGLNTLWALAHDGQAHVELWQHPGAQGV
eukprot:gene35235-43448_t